MIKMCIYRVHVIFYLCPVVPALLGINCLFNAVFTGCWWILIFEHFQKLGECSERRWFNQNKSAFLLLS